MVEVDMSQTCERDIVRAYITANMPADYESETAVKLLQQRRTSGIRLLCRQRTVSIRSELRLHCLLASSSDCTAGVAKAVHCQSHTPCEAPHPYQGRLHANSSHPSVALTFILCTIPRYANQSPALRTFVPARPRRSSSTPRPSQQHGASSSCASAIQHRPFSWQSCRHGHELGGPGSLMQDRECGLATTGRCCLRSRGLAGRCGMSG